MKIFKNTKFVKRRLFEYLMCVCNLLNQGYFVHQIFGFFLIHQVQVNQYIQRATFFLPKGSKNSKHAELFKFFKF